MLHRRHVVSSSWPETWAKDLVLLIALKKLAVDNARSGSTHPVRMRFCHETITVNSRGRIYGQDGTMRGFEHPFAAVSLMPALVPSEFRSVMLNSSGLAVYMRVSFFHFTWRSDAAGRFTTTTTALRAKDLFHLPSLAASPPRGLGSTKTPSHRGADCADQSPTSPNFPGPGCSGLHT